MIGHGEQLGAIVAQERDANVAFRQADERKSPRYSKAAVSWRDGLWLRRHVFGGRNVAWNVVDCLVKRRVRITDSCSMSCRR